MTYEESNAFCGALPATSYAVQWGGSHVWKVGRKVFAIGGWQDDDPSFTFKVSDIAYEILKEQPGLRPAPYLASRGMKWILPFAKPGLENDALRDYIRQSHSIVSQGLTRKKRIAGRRFDFELGGKKVCEAGVGEVRHKARPSNEVDEVISETQINGPNAAHDAPSRIGLMI